MVLSRASKQSLNYFRPDMEIPLSHLPGIFQLKKKIYCLELWRLAAPILETLDVGQREPVRLLLVTRFLHKLKNGYVHSR